MSELRSLQENLPQLIYDGNILNESPTVLLNFSVFREDTWPSEGSVVNVRNLAHLTACAYYRSALPKNALCKAALTFVITWDSRGF